MANDGLGNHGYIEYRSPPISLSAGVTYTFMFKTGDKQDANGYDCMLIDYVRVAEMSVVDNPLGSFTKAGAGALTVPYMDKPGTVNVADGTLAANGLFVSNTVNVASDATFAFRASSVANIPNSSFEEGMSLEGDGFSYAGTISGWTLEGGVISTTRAGWQRNGGTVTKNGPYTTNGLFTAYLRPECSIATGVHVPHDGMYELSFEQASRWGAEDSSLSRGILLTITATIDGNEVLVVPPRNITGRVQEEFNRVSAVVTLAAGYHNLKIETDDANGALTNNAPAASGTMVFIDNVQLVASSRVDFADLGATWNFASGATVDVGDADIELDKVYVNGVRIRGGANTFRAAGLNVLGTGSFRSGPPSGLRVFIK
jgi:hypothetical protein